MLAAQYRRTSTGAGDRVCRAPSIVFGGGTCRLINSSEVGLVPLIVFPRLEFLLEGRSPVLEEFLLPAVEDCWLEPRIIAELRDGFLLQQMPSHDGERSLPACSAPVASSWTLSFTFWENAVSISN